MSTSQQQDCKKITSAGTDQRLLALFLFSCIAAGFLLIRLSASGVIDLGFIFGSCAFKQRSGLPCPGCGITHSAQAFTLGHIAQSFYIQPAGCILCLTAILTAIFALLVAAFGVHFGLLQRRIFKRVIIYALIFLTIVFLAGWLTGLFRAFTRQAAY